jgi:phosphate transport system permease protein
MMREDVTANPFAHTTTTAIPRDLAWRKAVQALGFALIWLAGGIAVAALVWIVGYVVLNGLQVVNLEFLTMRPAGGVSGEGGMSTTIVTTLYLVVLTLVIATPLGVGAAIYLSEYAAEVQRESKLARIVVQIARTGVEILAGVPSIIFGLFGFALFVSALKLKFSLLSAGLSGACLVLPVIIRTSEEALMAVPRAYREGSLALGATRWQTIVSVVLPAAAPGIVTGVVLSVGRIVAETAFLVTLGGSSQLPQFCFPRPHDGSYVYIGPLRRGLSLRPWASGDSDLTIVVSIRSSTGRRAVGGGAMGKNSDDANVKRASIN